MADKSVFEGMKGVAAPARRALAAADVEKLSDLTRFSESELSALHGMGPTAITVLREALTASGLSFKE